LGYLSAILPIYYNYTKELCLTQDKSQLILLNLKINQITLLNFDGAGSIFGDIYAVTNSVSEPRNTGGFTVLYEPKFRNIPHFSHPRKIFGE
jgi:hypothetical protein